MLNYLRESTMALKKITKISTVCKVFSKKPTNKKCLSEIHKLLQIYCGIALVSAFTERCFSVMRKIKTWLKSNMRDKILTVSIIECLQIFIEIVGQYCCDIVQ